MRQADAMTFKMANAERRASVMVALINFHLPQRMKGFLDRYYSSRPSRRRIAGFDPLPTLATGCFAPFEPAALELLLRGDPPCPEPSAHHYTSRDQAH
jgi:hypothetical protein